MRPLHFTSNVRPLLWDSPLVLQRSCKHWLIEASPDRNTWIPSNWWMKKQSTLQELGGQNLSWNRSVQVRASKQSLLNDVRRKPVAPTFWVEKLLADVLLEFSFHTPEASFWSLLVGCTGCCLGPKASRIHTQFFLDFSYLCQGFIDF